jgi:hypothetical protein
VLVNLKLSFVCILLSIADSKPCISLISPLSNYLILRNPWWNSDNVFVFVFCTVFHQLAKDASKRDRSVVCMFVARAQVMLEIPNGQRRSRRTDNPTAK